MRTIAPINAETIREMRESEPRHLDLVDRLRGQYHLPVNDGAGPLNGSMTFSREFPTPPIQKEAADEIERLRKSPLPPKLAEVLADIIEYLKDREDADQPAGCDHPIPNTEMRLLVSLRAAMGMQS